MAGSPDEHARQRRFARIQAFLDQAEEVTPLVAVDTPDGRYLLSTADRHVTTSLLLKGARGEMKTLRHAVGVLDAVGLGTNGGTFVDVGANIGTTTVTALLSGRFSRALACEPEPRNAALLRLNLVANGLECNATVCESAVGERDGDVELLVVHRKSGMHQVHREGTQLPDWDPGDFTARTTPQVRLDALAERGSLDPEDAGLLWIDAQGNEGHILRGATLLTRRGTPVVLELDPPILAQHDGLDLVRDTAATEYTHFVSLRQIRGRSELRFDLEPTSRLDEEIEWLMEARRFTDILLLRNPLTGPRGRGAPRRGMRAPGPPLSSAPAPTPRSPGASEQRRKHVVKEAREFTPLIAAELDHATLLVRTDIAEETSLFVRRDATRLQLLAGVVRTLERAPQARRAAGGAFLDVGAGTGIMTVAALRMHGLERAIAIEADADAWALLRLNVALNDLADRVRVLEAEPASSPRLDGLVSSGLLDPEEVSLAWLRNVTNETLDGASVLLGKGMPAVLELDSRAAADKLFLVDGRLDQDHTHFLRVGKAPAGPRFTRIAALPEYLARMADGPSKNICLLFVHLETSTSGDGRVPTRPNR